MYPRTLAARTISASWWLVCIMVLVVYTAQLTSSLTIDKGELQMEKLEDLLQIPDIIVGLNDGISTSEVFKYTDYVSFQMMYSKMRATSEDSLNNNHGKGYSKVRERIDFVYLTESPYLHYAIGQPPCVTAMFTGINAPKTGGGLALVFSKENSHWRDLVNTQMASYFQNGFLADNFRHWFEERRECPVKSKAASGSGNMSVEKTAGIFVVFCSGLAIAFVSFIIKRILLKDADNVGDKKAANETLGEIPIELSPN